MIIFWIIDGLFFLVEKVISLISLPTITDDMHNKVMSFITYITDNASIVWFFIPKQTFLALLTITISTIALYYAYLAFMWVYKKIPFTGAS